MKKSYLILAAAATMFAACSQDALIDESVELAQGGETAITFGSFAGKQVKAETADNSSAENKFNLENYHTQFYVWGYKKVGENFVDVFTGNDAGAGAIGAEKSIVKHTGSTTNPYTNGWEYTPIRYWDKAATYYNFFAVAPAEPLNSDWAATTTDKDKVTFKIADYQLTGYSLKQSDAVVNDETALFGESNEANEDLLVATDILNNNADHLNNVVNFDFNHILSRLNIAVNTNLNQIPGKKNKTPLTYDNESETVTTSAGTMSVTLNGDFTLYTDGTNEYIYLDNVDGVTGFFNITSFEQYAGAGSLVEATVEDAENPVGGVIKLTEVKVVNLKSKGTYTEDAADAELKAGTVRRWVPGAGTVTEVGVKFDNGSTLASPTTTVDNLSNNVYYGGSENNTTEKATNVLSSAYNYIYQGLVIPQTVAYAECPLNGVGLDENSAPYVKVVYTIDGDQYSAYYNLAEIFNNATLNEPLTGTYGTAYYAKNASGEIVYIYNDGFSTWKDKDGKVLSDGTDPYTLKDESGNEYTLVDKTGATTGLNKVLVKDDADSSAFSFNEGWMYNLKLTISPNPIVFDAQVFEWAVSEKEGLVDIK